MLIVYKYTMRMNPKNITMMMMTLMQLFQAKRISHVFVKIDKKWNTQQILQKGLEDTRRVVLTFKMDQITCVSYSNQTENSMTHSYVGDCISCFFVVSCKCIIAGSLQFLLWTLDGVHKSDTCNKKYLAAQDEIFIRCCVVVIW